MMRHALDFQEFNDHSSVVEVREAWLIGAAQPIIRQGPVIFREVMNAENRKAAREAERAKAKYLFKRCIPFRRRRRNDQYEEYDLEKWRKWRHMFGDAAVDETYGKPCREIAQKAADLMALQENFWDEEHSAEMGAPSIVGRA